MLFSRNWLAEYVLLPDGVEEVADRLTAAGLAVEKIEVRGKDFLLDVDVTTNRPDCMNHLGMARELSVLFDQPLMVPQSRPDETGEAANSAVRIEIEDGQGCSRYVAKVVRDVRVGPSSAWLSERIESIGLRPINNVVDITNFVLWETGQPLHAFDYDTIAEGAIVVRRAYPGESLTTLDGEARELSPEVLVIADPKRAIALAGIMGGLETEVGETTVNVLLESAHFHPSRVRLGAGELGVHTDASHRFERGADPDLCLYAAERAAGLMAEIGGGKVMSGAVDVVTADLPSRPEGVLHHEKLTAFAGIEIETADVTRWLEGLGFAPRNNPVGEWQVTVPSWRIFDFQPREDGSPFPADLYEEILRIHGYDGIPSRLPKVEGPDSGSGGDQELRDRIRTHLAACGFAEAINYSFYSQGDDDSIAHLENGAGALRLGNPLSEQYEFMRRSLLPGLVENARFNQRRGAGSVRLFELGGLFPGDREEKQAVAMVSGGLPGRGWDDRDEIDIFRAKGVVESLASIFGHSLEARPADLRGFIAGTASELLVEGEPSTVIGHFGRLEDEDILFPLFVTEILIQPLLDPEASRKIQVPSRFPGICADLTLTHAVSVKWAEIRAEIESVATPELASFGIKGRYDGDGVPDGAVNTTVSFLYNAEDRSLTQEEVNGFQAALTAVLDKRFGWRR